MSVIAQNSISGPDGFSCAVAVSWWRPGARLFRVNLPLASTPYVENCVTPCTGSHGTRSIDSDRASAPEAMPLRSDDDSAHRTPQADEPQLETGAVPLIAGFDDQRLSGLDERRARIKNLRGRRGSSWDFCSFAERRRPGTRQGTGRSGIRYNPRSSTTSHPASRSVRSPASHSQRRRRTVEPCAALHEHL